MHTKVTLSNGLVVANFSSSHSFEFEDGNILAGCSKERCMNLMLNAKDVEVRREVGGISIIDIDLSFEMTHSVMSALISTCMDAEVMVVLVPLPVMRCIPEDAPECVKNKARVIRVANRVTRAICIDRFCI
jgi:hypothetical protein